MRISLGMMADNSLRNIEANQARMEALQNQLTSGSRITKPSDDPIGAARALGLCTPVLIGADLNLTH